jgi:pimeloyl-ACP methyl ester carboxylesterase
MVEDLWRYMDHQGISSTKIIGHSMGGKTAMWAACSQPERIQQLLVADIGPKAYPPHHLHILEAMKSLAGTPPASRQEACQLLEKKGLASGIVQFLLKNLERKPDQTLGWKLNLPVLYQSMESIGTALPPDMNYPGPTLFLRGAQSTYILDADRPQIIGHFPKARIDEISEAGHWLHAENPRDILAKSLEFLTQSA